MVTQTQDSLTLTQFGAKIAPLFIVLLACIGVRTSLAATYPSAALIVFLWVVTDTMMLSLVARSPGRRPSRRLVLGALAGASIIVWLGSPAALREALLAMPALSIAMAIVVLTHIAWATARARRVFRAAGPAAQDPWLAAASEFLPQFLVRFAGAEMSIIYMALFRWGGPADVPPGCRAFSYHKHLTPMCAALLALSIIEAAIYHLLVGNWSRTAARVMFVLSDVGLIYLIGLIKSFRLRPVLVTPDGLRVRAGLLIDRLIPLDAIASVDSSFPGSDIRDPATLNAALLAWPNIVVRLKEPVARRPFIRRRKPFSRIAFRLDDPEPFVRLLKWQLGQNGNRSEKD